MNNIYYDPDDLPYTEALQYRLTKAWSMVQGRHEHRNSNVSGRELQKLQINDQVLLWSPDYPGRAAKLGRPWKGPYTVIRNRNNNTVDIRDVESRFEPFQVNRRRVKPYNSARPHAHPADPNLELEGPEEESEEEESE